MNRNIPVTMDKNYHLSIITVNLDNLKGLKRTMQSVFDQTWQEFEYIVIDGGSKDGSKEYIEANFEKIDYWISEPDEGVYNAMNKGIKNATGKFLFFLNSGDWFCNEKIVEKVIPHLSDIDVVYGNLIKVYPDGGKELDKGIAGNPITFKTFAQGNLNHQATFISQELFQDYGNYDTDLNIVADWKFFLFSLGLHDSKVEYLDFEITYYDMQGLSSDIRTRDMERKFVLENQVPNPIYADYLRLKEIEIKFSSNRIGKFLITDEKPVLRKLHSIIFRLFS